MLSSWSRMIVRMKANFFDPKDLFCIIGFLDAFMLECYTNRINEGAALRALTCYVNERLATSFNSRMRSAGKSSPIGISLHNVYKRSRKLFRSYQ